MPTYSAAQIVGKNLIAASPIPVRRIANDNAPIVYTVPTGQPVGVVDTYLLPNENRSTVYWVFNDANGRPYYTPHREGLYSLTALKEQGTVTVKEQTEQATQAQETTGQMITKNLRFIVLIAAGAFILKSFLPELIKKR